MVLPAKRAFVGVSLKTLALGTWARGTGLDHFQKMWLSKILWGFAKANTSSYLLSTTSIHTGIIHNEQVNQQATSKKTSLTPYTPQCYAWISKTGLICEIIKCIFILSYSSQ